VSVDKVVDFTAYSQKNTRPDRRHHTPSEELSKAIQHLIERLRDPSGLDFEKKNRAM